MIDSTRLENNLIHVARRYAPALIPAGWQKAGDYPNALPDLARALASYNVLIMVGDMPPSAIKAWTDGYSSFYSSLATALFPSYTRVSAFYLDQAAPQLVALYGEATPVITGLAGFVVPYVVARQGTRPLDVELLGMVDMMLEELEATDLPRDDYRRLRDSGAAHLRGLLDGEGRQFPLTPAARPIFAEMSASPSIQAPARQATQPPPPADLPETLVAPPPLPDSMPEQLSPPPDTLPEAPAAPAAPEPPSPRKFDPDAVPIFFNPQRGGSTGSAAPPVPPLPRR